MQFTPYHQAKGFAQGIVPFVPLFGGDSCPDMGIIHELAQGCGLKDLGLGVQGDILLIVKGSGQCAPGGAGHGTAVLDLLAMNVANLYPSA